MFFANLNWKELLGYGGAIASIIAVGFAIESKYSSKTLKRILKGLVCLVVLGALAICYFDARSVHERLESLNEVLHKTQSKRVVLLLPTGYDDANVMEDLKHQFLGFLDFQAGNSFDIDVVVKSHAMNPQYAETIVIDEMRNGTKYFVVTMSRVAEPLSKRWRILTDKYCQSEECYLIATVASASGIPSNGEGVYRFYVRSEEEGPKLAVHAINEGAKTAFAICVNDHYGKGAAASFAEYWTKANRIVSGYIYYRTSESNDDKNEKFKKLYELPQEARDCIFIADYGGGMAETIHRLECLEPPSLLLLTSTFSIAEWREKADKRVLANWDWMSVVPVYSSNAENYKDVVRDFTHFTLTRVGMCISAVDRNHTSFDEEWLNLKYPDVLRHSPVKDVLDHKFFGDHEIGLKLYGP